ncbi:MAG: hypothetical protein UU59_C0021G0006 [candidate division WWE3 bacterium GW2011_GWE1_41_27]|uniref:Glycosyltransferase RgtA/B/C/D-like domain-containing protein n=2 Tax=Katanobacteria TaxID=422282 RepID=A0A0G1AFT9_UNCKA|nr:MAG: hypothetical protein UU59_C0021G0006 [candidate division WWE3 bacterium GW2011_GWE1_41_27]KKS59814.1 MAG: hypothetical protein UV26_C0014G0007 [candidate division WWE3 bacterium GW2011_GWF2_42_42]
MFTTLLHKITKYPVVQIILVAVVFVLGILIRTQYFDQESKDIYAYTKAIADLTSGINPYKWTVETFSNIDDPSNHGFAYLPGMLYLDTALMYLGDFLKIDFKYIWKVPVLIADIGIGIFIFLATRKRSFFLRILMVAIWFFNPYAYFRGGYTYFDPITIFFMLLSLYYLEKNSVKSGLLYALAISTKTFPYLIFPVFVFTLLPVSITQFKQNKNILKTELAKFLMAGLAVAILISLPFMKSVEDFSTYLNGAVFVHAERFVQGRPFLYYISYYWKIELFRIIPFGVYTILASFSGWILLAFVWFKKITKDKYILSVIPFLTFYLFTPVLNRTYLTWFLPLFLIATTRIFRKWYYVVLVNATFYVFCAWYLIPWERGFHEWHP